MTKTDELTLKFLLLERKYEQLEKTVRTSHEEITATLERLNKIQSQLQERFGGIYDRR